METPAFSSGLYVMKGIGEGNMKITKVDIILVDTKPADGNKWTPVLCRVYTDE